jgi:hypothetical protein
MIKLQYNLNNDPVESLKMTYFILRQEIEYYDSMNFKETKEISKKRLLLIEIGGKITKARPAVKLDIMYNQYVTNSKYQK